MVLRWVPAAVLAVVAGLSVANAQSAGDFGGPRELPPASFDGQQYVDSRGCVYLRAGLSGRTNWVPRVSRNRTPLCGYPPTFGNNQVAITDPPPRPAADAALVAPPVRASVQAEAPPAPQPRVRTAPASRDAAPPAAALRVAPAPPVAQPVTTAAPRRQSSERLATRAPRGKIGCYTDTPVAERFRLQTGGSIVLCTRGDGDLAHARAPRLLAGTAAVAPSGSLEGPAPTAYAGPRHAPPHAAAAVPPPVMPKGYRAAFTDDRLNPHRAKGTRQGWAQQDQIWTREVPARLVTDGATGKGAAGARRKVAALGKSKSVPTQEGSNRSFVQVGTFGQASNADGAASRLAGLGLPVARSRVSSKGRPMQIIFAGPFGSRAEAKAALSAARRAGFGDAFIR